LDQLGVHVGEKEIHPLGDILLVGILLLHDETDQTVYFVQTVEYDLLEWFFEITEFFDRLIQNVYECFYQVQLAEDLLVQALRYFFYY